MRTIRVAHVITRLCRGGAQENTFHTVRLLRTQDSALSTQHSFIVDLISGPSEGPEGSMEPRIAGAGIPILHVPHLVRPARSWHDIRALNHLTNLFRQNRYDIVHTHTSKAGFLGRWAAHRAGVPIIVHTPHGHVFDGYFWQPVTQLYIRLERWAARFTDRIVALTEDEIDTYLGHGIGCRKQYVVIPSGVDLAPFAQARANRDSARANLGIPPDALVVGAVGRLEPVKGIEYLIHAAPRILEQFPRSAVLIVGEGSLKEPLCEQAQPCGERIRFLGYREDVPQIMAALDILVVPSLNEGMGRVVVEAGAAGVPVVASAVGGLRHVVDADQTGILVPPRDDVALAQAIRGLACDPERRKAMGEAARRKMIPEYGVETMVERIVAVYNQLLEEK